MTYEVFYVDVTIEHVGTYKTIKGAKNAGSRRISDYSYKVAIYATEDCEKVNDYYRPIDGDRWLFRKQGLFGKWIDSPEIKERRRNNEKSR